MKQTWIILFSAILLASAPITSQAETEQSKYKVIDRLQSDIEIRRYGPRTVAEVEIPISGDRAVSRQAFRILAGYIFGKNKSKSKIAMTAPVETERPGQKISMTAPVETQASVGKFRMAFFLPVSYSAKTAPDPIDKRIKIRTVPATTIATIRYSGISGKADKKRYWQTLKTKLIGSNWRIVGKPVFFGYDPPWTLPFNRRNEVGVKVEALPKTNG